MKHQPRNISNLKLRDENKQRNIHYTGTKGFIYWQGWAKLAVGNGMYRQLHPQKTMACNY